jgi:Cu+-exporting ATPase
MHREFSPLERLTQPESHGGLYLFTALVGLLIGLDLWPALAGWLNSTWQWSLPVGADSLFFLGRSFRFALLAALLGGARVLYTSAENLLSGKLGADLALGLAVVAAILIGQPLVAAEVVFIGLLGECLEAFTFGRTQHSLQKLVETCPRMCFVLRDGQEQKVRVEEVQPGELVKVLPGKRVPVDGIVTEGRTTIDQSTLTGERLPVDKGVGDEVFAGTINQQGALVVQVRRVSTQTVMGRVIELTVQAVKEKTSGGRTADLMARYFLPIVLAVALLTFLASWWWLRSDDNALLRAVYPALSVLVVACPCALILATPAALLAAVGRLARTGVILKSGVALERLATVTCFAFDKTGTLTEGRMQVGSLKPLDTVTPEELLQLAATAEQNSEHPLATVILREARAKELALESLTDFQAAPGAGVVAQTATQTLLVGNLRLLREHRVAIPPEAESLLVDLDGQGQTVLLVAAAPRETETAGKLLGLIGIWDAIRPEAAAVIAELQRSGIRECVMLTGDRQAAARSVAERLGLEQVQAELLPGQKVEWIAQRQADGQQVAMVGDGVNDAPALAKATTGLALGRTGSDIAAEAGDIVLMGDPLKPLPLLLRLSRQTVAIIRQNILIFAFGVNAFGVLLTAWILPFWSDATRQQAPLWAAVYHQIGSLAVLLNAMRLLWFERGQESPTYRQVSRFTEKLEQALERLNLHDASHWVAERWKILSGWAAALLVVAYSLSGLTMVPADAIGIVRRCGRPLPEDLAPGLHWRLPWPWEQVTIIEPQRLRQVEIGFRTVAGSDESGASWAWTSTHTAGMLRDPEEALMLTGDGDMLEAQVIVHYTLANPRRFLWEAAEPEPQLRAMAEAAVRQLLAERPFFEVLAGDRRRFQEVVTQRLQQGGAATLQRLGVAVHSVTVQDLHPPSQPPAQAVLEAFYDLTRAQAEKARVISDAQMQAETAISREKVTRARILAEAQGRFSLARAQATAERDVFLWMVQAQRLTLLEPWMFPMPSVLFPCELAWRCQYDHLLASPQALTQFRLTVEAAEQILSNRAKVLQDPTVPAPLLVNPDILRLRLPTLGRERPRPPLGEER